MNLDVVDVCSSLFALPPSPTRNSPASYQVISMIPPEWPLRILSTFVTRSLRRTLHAHHEGQIVKAISAGQNLAVAEQTWAVIRDQGAIVEEPVTDDEEGLDGGEKLGLELGERVQGEPASFNEKVGLQVRFADSGQDGEGVVDINVAPESEADQERWLQSHRGGEGYDVGT